jgi:hypothetical protein
LFPGPKYGRVVRPVPVFGRAWLQRWAVADATVSRLTAEAMSRLATRRAPLSFADFSTSVTALLRGLRLSVGSRRILE